MYINQIISKIQNNTESSLKYNNKPYNIYPSFTARVDKGMARFYEVNENRMPATVRTYIESLKDKFSITPLEAQRKAYERLQEAKNINDVKILFPYEDLFKNLIPSIETKATNGILGLFREFKEIYQSILNSGEDLSVYLLKKLFMDSKTIDEINLDLEQDLNVDIAQEFKNRNGDADYIQSSTLKAMGILTPDVAYQNSLRFTRDGYSDKFGLKISEAQLRYWNSLTDEQKFEILSKRLEGRDNWWNSLSYKEKLEYAAGIESEDELYHNYKKYVSLQKRRKTYGDVGEEGSRLNNVQLTKKKIAVGSKLNHKDIFALWMKNNLKNYYNRLSEADKDSVHIIRVRRLAVRWQSLTPEEKMQRINEIRADREPIKYAMIDAWNHSHNIIKELSKFLKEKQILKPVDMLYQDEGFSEFQSAVMTEFWATYPEFAVQLGENIKNAIERVQDSISRGQFQDLQQEIQRDRAFRKNLVKRELKIEEDAKLLQAVEPKTAILSDYKNEFAQLYKDKFNADKILPESYVNDVVSNMLEHKSEEWIKKYTDFLKSGKGTPSLEIMEDLLKDETLLYNSDKQRSSRAFEFAVANEFYAKKHDPNVYNVEAVNFETVLRKEHLKEIQNNTKKADRINLERIEKLYNEYKKDLPEDELRDYVLDFFVPISNNNTDIHGLTDYLRTYGKGLSILFSEQSQYPTSVKCKLKDKFLRFMPQDLKNKYFFLLDTNKKIEDEKLIKKIDNELSERFNFINKDFLKRYINEVKNICRYFEEKHDNEVAIMYRPDNYLKFMGKERATIKNKVTNIPVPRDTLPKRNKYDFLAMEQALADELFDACGDEIVYKLTFEALCDLFEQAERLKKYPKTTEQKILITEAFYDIDNKSLSINKIPNKRNVNQRYYEYCSDFKEVEALAKSENREIDKEDLLCWLNPVEGNNTRDKMVMKRIGIYYDEY